MDSLISDMTTSHIAPQASRHASAIFPTEIWIMIGSRIEKRRDLANFRAACRAFSEYGLPNALRKIYIYAYPPHLRNLQSIADDPEKAPYVKELIFYPYGIGGDDRDDDDDGDDGDVEDVEDEDEEDEEDDEDDENSEDDENASLDSAVAWVDWHAFVKEFDLADNPIRKFYPTFNDLNHNRIPSSELKTLICSAFADFIPKLKNLQDVRLHQRQENYLNSMLYPERPWRWFHDYRGLRQWVTCPSEIPVPKHLKPVAQSIHWISNQVRPLTALIPDGVQEPGDDSESEPWLLKAIMSSFQGRKRQPHFLGANAIGPAITLPDVLHISHYPDFLAGLTEIELGLDMEQELPLAGAFLRALPNLESMALSLNDKNLNGYGFDSLYDLRRGHHWPRLRRVALTVTHVHKRPWQKFLDVHGNQLKVILLDQALFMENAAAGIPWDELEVLTDMKTRLKGAERVMWFGRVRQWKEWDSEPGSGRYIPLSRYLTRDEETIMPRNAENEDEQENPAWDDIDEYEYQMSEMDEDAESDDDDQASDWGIDWDLAV
ncbi:hypothetical protein V8F33_003669 [Rhypophila sp. PSN 637]